MALPRAFLAFLLLMVTLHLVHSSHVFEDQSQMLKRSARSLITVTMDCPGACRVRCSKSWKPKLCNRMCGACCSRCNCVPPGTGVETRATCPCYANMKNPKGKLKCP